MRWGPVGQYAGEHRYDSFSAGLPLAGVSGGPAFPWVGLSTSSTGAECVCGRFVQLPLFDKSQAPWPELADDLAGVTAKYNLAPTQRAAVVLGGGDKLELRKLRWGLIPPWAKDLKTGFTTINARVETVATKPAYRAAWKAPLRCLVPMAGYYEWRDENAGKQPYYIARADGAMLYAAGLWEPRHHLQPPEDDSDGSVTVITHDAVELAGTVHDRMPVFLDPTFGREWMTATSEDAMDMLLAATVPALRIVRVSRAINSSRNRGGPDSVEAVAE